MTAAPLRTPSPTRARRPAGAADRASAALLGVLSAAFFWTGLLLGAGGIAGPEADGFLGLNWIDQAVGIVLVAAALLALAPGRPWQGLARAGLLLGGIYALAAPLGLASLEGGVAALLEGLRLWPETLAALAAGLALAALARQGGDDPTGPADLALGTAVAGAVLSALALPGLPPEALTPLTRGPLHLALVLTAAAVTVVLARAALGGITPRARRMVVGLTALLPLLGFAGTILGIMVALGALPGLLGAPVPTADGGTTVGAPDPEALGALLTGLSGAFETTLIGLVAAAAAGFALTLIEAGRDN